MKFQNANKINTNFWLEFVLLLLTKTSFLAAPISFFVFLIVLESSKNTTLAILAVTFGIVFYLSAQGVTLWVKKLLWFKGLTAEDLAVYNEIYAYWNSKKDPPKLFISISLSSCWTPGTVFLKHTYLRQPAVLWKYTLDHEYAHSIQQDAPATLTTTEVECLLNSVTLQAFCQEDKEDLIIEIDADAYALMQCKAHKSKQMLENLFELTDRVENPLSTKVNEQILIRGKCLEELQRISS